MIIDKLIRRDFLSWLWAGMTWACGLYRPPKYISGFNYLDKLIEIPADLPAISIPFDTLPTAVFIGGPHYKIMISQLMMMPKRDKDIAIQSLLSAYRSSLFAPARFRMLSPSQARRRCILEEPI